MAFEGFYGHSYRGLSDLVCFRVQICRFSVEGFGHLMGDPEGPESCCRYIASTCPSELQGPDTIKKTGRTPIVGVHDSSRRAQERNTGVLQASFRFCLDSAT